MKRCSPKVKMAMKIPVEEMVMGVGVAPLMGGGAQGGRRLPLQAAAPWPSIPGRGDDLEELLPLLGGCLWLGVSKSRVSPQYIEVKMQCDTHLIQELLNTSRTFLGTPLYPHKSIKTWIG
jgi:hypothetical protein